MLHEIMEGRASEAQTAALLIALRAKGETVDELAGLARTMRDLAVPGGHRAARPGGHRRHRRRAADLQRVHHRGVRGRRRGRADGQARQPLGHRPVGLGRRARGARRPHRPGARRMWPTCIEAIGFGFMFAPAAPPGHEARGARAQGPGRAHDLQLPRPADQPGRRHAPADRRLRRPPSWNRWPRALEALGGEHALVLVAPTTASTSLVPRATRVVELRGDGRPASSTFTPEDLGVEPAPAESRSAAGTPEQNAPVAARGAGRARPARSAS